MSENEVIEAARAKWNAEADEHNQWDELGCDEKLELAVRAAFESLSARLAWARPRKYSARLTRTRTKPNRFARA